MKLKLRYLLLLILCQTFVWYCAGVDNPFEPEEVTDVAIRNGQFSPSTVTVSVGTTVRWTNEDNVVRFVDGGEENMPSEDPDFGSGNLQPDDTYEHTFNNVGTFPYYNSENGATGRVVVTN